VPSIAKRILAGLLLVLLVAPAFTSAQDSITLVVTGSSMPEPLYQVWNDAYHKQSSSVQIRYLAGGTGDSVRNVLAGTGDFGGGDAPIPEKELHSSSGEILELPTVLIGIVVVYNFPGATGEMKFTGPVLASIFLGKIKSWDDPAIAKLNPGVNLPALSIQVLHRTEGKGSNYIFSDFLSKVSPEFLAAAGRSESPKWPVGTSFKRSQDLLEKAKSTPGSIGYTELNLAAKSGLHIAAIKNLNGDFIAPSSKSISAAALAVSGKMTGDFRVSLTNAPGKDSYPVSSYTWFYVPSKSKDPQRSRAISEYLRWVYASGQKIAQEEGYASLPEDVLTKVVPKLSSIH
jgi:phosphate transport system substrate-binding protein